MAVKTSWAAGDVLTAADLTDTFAAKANLSGATFTGLVTSQGTASGTPVQSVEMYSADAGGPLINLRKSRSATAGSFTIVQNGDSCGSIVFSGANGTGTSQAATITAAVDGTPGASNDMPGRLIFSTSADGSGTPTERMRIDSAGKVGIGVSPDASYQLALGGNLRLPINGSIETNGGTLYSTSIYNSTTATGANVSINAGGPIQRSTSSIKYKTDVQDLDPAYADKVLELRPVWYRSLCETDVEAHPNWSYYGLIAEEVADVEPRAVFWGQDENGNPEPEGVQYDRLVPHLISVVKRQQAQIDALTARLDAAGF